MQPLRLAAVLIVFAVACAVGEAIAQPRAAALQDWLGDWRALEPHARQCQGAHFLMIRPNGAGLSVAPVERLMSEAPETLPYERRGERLIQIEPELPQYRNWYERRGARVIAHFGPRDRCAFERVS